MTGWKAHWGGSMPRELGMASRVLTCHRNGFERKRPVVASTLNWFATGANGKDIMAYKVVSS